MAQNTDGYRKQINNVNDLPGFDKMYLFAGAPTREFDKTFRYFLSCLGNITQDGSSLLDTSVDSGATKHCCGDKSLFTEFKACFKQLTVADGAQTLIAGIGTVRLRMLDDDGIERTVILKDVLYVPALDTNLVSVRQLWKHNRISTRFKRDCVLKDRDGHKFTLANATGLFDFGAKAFHAAARSAKHAKHNRISFELLHKRLGHCGKNRCRLAPARSIGLPDIDWTGWQDYDCDACNRNARRP